jgi:hypothetical protein
MVPQDSQQRRALEQRSTMKSATEMQLSKATLHCKKESGSILIRPIKPL